MLGKKLHIKKNDLIMVIAGKDKYKTGKIQQILPKKDSVIVEGLNIVKKHQKARGNEVGGIIEKESPLHISNVMLYCAKCAKPVRTKIKVLEDNAKARICIKCGEAFDK